MPKLVIIAACEKCILDTDGSATLVNVFSALDLNAPPGQIIPEVAISPKPWAVYTQWNTLPDIGKNFVQQIVVSAPGGTEFGKAQDSFTATAASHGIRTNIGAMPIGKPGDIVIKVWLESDGKRVGEEHTYSIRLQHPKLEPTQ